MPRVAVALLAGALVTGSLCATSAHAATAGPTVTLSGGGASDGYQEQGAWNSDLAGTKLSLSYTGNSGFKGRQALLQGTADFAISGAPFTAQELGQLPGGASSLIAAPVLATAVGVMLTATPGEFQIQHWSCDPAQDSCLNDPNLTITTSPWPPGNPQPFPQFNVPPPNMAAMMLDPLLQLPSPMLGTEASHGAFVETYDEWDHPDIDVASGIYGPNSADDQFASSIGLVENRFGPQQTGLALGAGEIDYFAQLYAATAAPAVWAEIQQAQRTGPINPITDSLPAGLTRGQYLDQTPTGLVNRIEGQLGNVALVPPSALHQFAMDPAKQKLAGEEAGFLGVQNANGDYVTPTPASVEAAINAGGTTPLYALTNKVAGAYPLAYVDMLYAPAHGLSPDKTEAMATLIRYLATAGQEATDAVGDARLSPALVSQALDAANKLVRSNCSGAGVVVTSSSDPGPYMPTFTGSDPVDKAKAKDIAAIGTMLHCSPASSKPGSTTATTTPGAGSALAASFPSGGNAFGDLGSGDLGSLGGPSAGLGSTSPLGSTTGGSLPNGLFPTAIAALRNPTLARLKPSTHAPGSVSLVGLPLPLPWSGPAGWDRLGGMVLGALLLLFARRPVRALLRTLRS